MISKKLSQSSSAPDPIVHIPRGKLAPLPKLNNQVQRKGSDSIRLKSIRNDESTSVVTVMTTPSVPNPIHFSHKNLSREVSHKTSLRNVSSTGNMDGFAFFNGSNSLRLNTGNLRTAHLSTMMSVIQDPVQCGFLLEYCTRQHNSENLCFIMMVSRFRDAMSTDINVWPKSWAQVDSELLANNNIGTPVDPTETVWPSKVLSRDSINKLVTSIWDNFLSNDATNQICMPSQVAENTKRRIQYLDLYGPEVYTEALMDPIKTINKDVLPRFLASPLYADMKLRLSSLMQRSNSTTKLVVPPPDKMVLLEKKTEVFNEKRLFSLQEILDNKVLYVQFLTHLEKKMSAEDLLCYRMILIFEDLFEKQLLGINEGVTDQDQHTESDLRADQATNQAWVIYKYFIAPDAPYEVSLHSRHKKELMISLAHPYKGMFDELKKSTYSVLTVNFNAFKITEEYRNMWRSMRDARGGLSALVSGFTIPNMIMRATNTITTATTIIGTAKKQTQQQEEKHAE